MHDIDDLRPGAAACLFTDDMAAARYWLEEQASRSDDLRLVQWSCTRLPPLSRLSDAFLATMAEAAWMLWPDWPDDSPPAEDSSPNKTPDRQREVHAAWRRAAASRCERGLSPILNKHSSAMQIRQLARILAARRLVFVVIVEDPSPETASLLALARGLEWLARESQAGVLAVLPTSFKEHDALDSISFAELSSSPAGAASESPAADIQDRSEERKHVLCPVIGRPHPGSPGEQLLAGQLSVDEELAGQFEFNQRVVTRSDSRYLVDLLCRAGRLVVEVDGYGHHASRSAFNSDRQRDYELLISGYQVLRLPHDFVVQDVVLAVARIREVFRFRLRSLGQEVWS